MVLFNQNELNSIGGFFVCLFFTEYLSKKLRAEPSTRQLHGDTGKGRMLWRGVRGEWCRSKFGKVFWSCRGESLFIYGSPACNSEGG